MKFFLAGQWQDRDQRIEVTNPSNGEIIDSVPVASAEDVESALVAAVRGAEIMEKLTGYERFRVLRRAADLITERRESLARSLSREQGKTLREALVEVDRSAQTLELSGEEAKRL
ncbi:MAG: aldehyde dehydrogenase family protein, partial [Pirellula sp.]